MHPQLRLVLLPLVILIALAAVMVLSSRPQELSKPQPELFAWSIPEEQIERISISLPGESQGVAFTK